MNLPTQDQCLQYFKDYKVPKNIFKHCLKVQEVSMCLAGKLKEAGVEINLELVRTGSILHDLFKVAGIKNVKPNKFHSYKFSKEELDMRDKLKARFPGKHETQIAYEIFKEDYPELALFLLKEGEHKEGEDDISIEIKVIRYIDARVFRENVVLLEDRFAYFKEVYKREGSFWEDVLIKTKEQEKLLFEKINITPEELKENVKG